MSFTKDVEINIECPLFLYKKAFTFIERLIEYKQENKSFTVTKYGHDWFYGHEEKLGCFVEYLGEDE